ncbi:MAG: peptide MFS transporter [Crocinitomicaceae bacterium]|nr:peptide MFS transporter [Crocinitomicaceae bacterium]
MASKHPKALPYLFFSEMWERFGYYLMIGIFTLYLKDKVDGFGMDEASASDLYGTFIALVFLTPFVGGLLADRIIGYRKSIVFGGILMGIGYCLMAIHDINMLYLSMFLVIVGNGFFKPNISTLLGNIYNEDKYKSLKDSGYSLFYMGINIGAFICNFFGAAMYNMLGWGAAFITAGVGMFIGIAIFWSGTRHFKHADVIKPKTESDMSLIQIFGAILLPAIGFGLIGYFLPEPLVKTRSTDAFLFGCIPVVFFYVRLLIKSPKKERRPISAMLAIFALVIAFWAVFKQNGSTLNTWADQYTDREVPTAVLPVMKSLKQVKDYTYKKDSIEQTDHQFRAIKVDGQPVMVNDYPDFFKNMKKEDKPADGKSIHTFNTNLFQSVNPFWVIALTPLVLAFFGFLRRKGKEPSTPTKIAFGLLISALSCLVMVAAVYSSENGAVKTSAWWFISSYAVITIGELFLSPMGLSMVSKLSPPRLTALMMGGWFLATSIGNKLSGLLSSFWDGYTDKANFFYVNSILLLCAGLIMFGMLKWLNKIFKEHV